MTRALYFMPSENVKSWCGKALFSFVAMTTLQNMARLSTLFRIRSTAPSLIDIPIQHVARFRGPTSPGRRHSPLAPPVALSHVVSLPLFLPKLPPRVFMEPALMALQTLCERSWELRPLCETLLGRLVSICGYTELEDGKLLAK